MNQVTHTLFIILICIGSALPPKGMFAQEMPTRYPLLELFTNTPCPICGNQDPGFFNRLSGYEGQYHLVSFYPGIPYSSCIFYQANISENTARKNFYPQIFGVPDVGINGTEFKSPNSVSTTVLDDITGNTSWLSVKVDETTGVSRDVTITLEDHGGGDLETGILFAVIVEREIMYDAPNGIMLHHNVFREFLTDVDGDEVTFGSGTIVKSYDYDLDVLWQEEETHVVAWLMDPETREVVNSGTRFDETTSSLLSPVKAISLEVFPNPASDYVQVRIPERNGDQLRIFDASGRIVYSQSGIGTGLVNIPLNGLPNGSYIVELGLEDGVGRGRFEVVN